MKLPSLCRQDGTDLVEDDAVALIASVGASAYDEARTKAREERSRRVIDSYRPAGHWDKIRREIARRTGRQIGTDTATRYPSG